MLVFGFIFPTFSLGQVPCMYKLEMHENFLKGFLPLSEVNKEVCRVLNRGSKDMSDKLGHVSRIFT